MQGHFAVAGNHGSLLSNADLEKCFFDQLLDVEVEDR